MTGFLTHGRILGGTATTPDLNAALTDYRDRLGLKLVEQGDVAADVGHEVFIGDLGSEEEAEGVRGNFEVDEAQFAHRIDDDHAALLALEVHQGPHETRMVARGVSADQEEEIAPGDIIQRDGRGA